MASRLPLAIVSFLLLASTLAARARAQATPELPSSKQEVSNALADLRDRYGLDAVKLESFLLQYAIEAGAVLTTSVGTRGVEKVGEHSYLQVDFDSGIIYSPPEVSRAQAPARIWSDIVDPTLRQFESMQVAADGIVLRIRFRHSPDGASEILRERKQDSIPVDVVTFRILCPDIVEAVGSGATPTQLLARATVLLNDDATTLVLDEVGAAHRPKGTITPALPLE
jgi:hypothetical protein